MHPTKSLETPRQQGFTLIELSIVLVIIGLIVGGVLVGQDLIKAAQIRATITQMDSYSSAVNTFRTKFNGMPGDLSNCANFFSGAATDCPNTGTQGNNLFEDYDGAYLKLSGEVAAFWHHLYLASLIGDAMTNPVDDIRADGTPTLANEFPAAKIGSGNFLIAYSGAPAISNIHPGMAGVNLYRLTGLTSVNAGVPAFATDLTPVEAYGIDAKLDDGMPDTGSVQATSNTGGAFNTATDYVGTANTCTTLVTGTVNNVYNTATGNGQQNSRLCELMIRPSF